MNRVSQFLALLLGSSAFISNYPSYAAKKYKSESGRADSVSDIRRRKKDVRKGKSAALVSGKKSGSKNSKIKSFATKSAATSKGNGNKFSTLWFLTGGGSGTAVAGLASWGGTKLYDWHKYKKLVNQSNPSGGNNEQFDQLQKDKLALEAALGSISPDASNAAISYAKFINAISGDEEVVSRILKVVFKDFSNDGFTCSISMWGLTALGGDHKFTVQNANQGGMVYFIVGDKKIETITYADYRSYYNADDQSGIRGFVLFLLADYMLKKIGFKFNTDNRLLKYGILSSVASNLFRLVDWDNFNAEEFKGWLSKSS